jgi:DNA-binding MarR family transcriptional regulator
MRDEVDSLIEAWERERPDLQYDSLAVLSRVSRLARHLDRARKATFAAHDLEPFEFDVLTALRRAGAPYELSPGALITLTLVTSGTMTNRLDRLEQRRLVTRRRDPEDGRGVRVRLTAKGRTRVDTAFTELLQRENELLAGLSERQRQALAAALRTVLAPFDAS